MADLVNNMGYIVTQAGYVTHEEEVGIAVLGRPYTIDLMAMRQVKILLLY